MQLTNEDRLREALKDIIEGYDGMLHVCDDPEDGCAEVWQEYIEAGRAALRVSSPSPVTLPTHEGEITEAEYDRRVNEAYAVRGLPSVAPVAMPPKPEWVGR